MLPPEDTERETSAKAPLEAIALSWLWSGKRIVMAPLSEPIVSKLQEKSAMAKSNAAAILVKLERIIPTS